MPAWLEALREDLFSCLFQFLEAACIFWLMSPSSHVWPLLPFHTFSDSDTHFYLLIGPVIHLSLTWVMQDNLPISRSLTLSHQQSPFCQVRWHSQILGIKLCTSFGGGIMSSTTSCWWVLCFIYQSLREHCICYLKNTYIFKRLNLYYGKKMKKKKRNHTKNRFTLKCLSLLLISSTPVPLLRGEWKLSSATISSVTF